MFCACNCIFDSKLTGVKGHGKADKHGALTVERAAEDHLPHGLKRRNRLGKPHLNVAAHLFQFSVDSFA